jgi:hypothetical protein
MNAQYRADFPAWVFIGGLSCFPWLILWINSHGRIDVVALLVAVGVSGFALAWLSSFKIVLTPTEVVFRSLFRGRHSLRHDEIGIVRLAWNLRSARGPLRLVVEPRDDGVRALEINAKVFSKTAIDAVLELGGKVAQADDGGLRDGVVARSVRQWKERKKR